MDEASPLKAPRKILLLFEGWMKFEVEGLQILLAEDDVLIGLSIPTFVYSGSIDGSSISSNASLIRCLNSAQVKTWAKNGRMSLIRSACALWL